MTRPFSKLVHILLHVSETSSKLLLQEISISFNRSAGLAKSVDLLTAEREVAGSILGVGPILRYLK